MAASVSTRSDRALDRWRLLLVSAGLALGVLMLARGQVGGDQLNLLARGWLFADGTWIHFGNPLSSGGNAPGSFTSLLVGLPLLVWRDFRAPAVLILLTHVAAYVLLDRLLARRFDAQARLLFAAAYWLNPWRIYHAAFLWNPNYLFLFGAIHLLTAWRLRDRPSLWATTAHVAATGLAAQIHPSTLLLMVTSALLWWRRRLRVSWSGIAIGTLLVALSLLPWLAAARESPETVTPSHGFLFRGLLLVFPVLRGVLYWLRQASLAAPQALWSLDFGDVAPDTVNQALQLAGHGIRALAMLSLVPSLLALLWLWRRSRRRRRATATSGRSRARSLLGRPAEVTRPWRSRVWIVDYVRLAFVAAVLVFCMSPTTIMSWQVLVLFHASALGLVTWATAVARVPRWRRSAWPARGAVAWCALALVIGLAAAFGGLHYRCAGHTGADSFGFPLRGDHPMFHRLGIQQACPWPLAAPGATWWPDVLDEPAATVDPAPAADPAASVDR